MWVIADGALVVVMNNSYFMIPLCLNVHDTCAESCFESCLRLRSAHFFFFACKRTRLLQPFFDDFSLLFPALSLSLSRSEMIKYPEFSQEKKRGAYIQLTTKFCFRFLCVRAPHTIERFSFRLFHLTEYIIRCDVLPPLRSNFHRTKWLLREKLAGDFVRKWNASTVRTFDCNHGVSVHISIRITKRAKAIVLLRCKLECICHCSTTPKSCE